MVPVPLLTPRLSSLWLALVSPVYARVGRELIDGVRNATVVQDDRALRDFAVRPRGIREVLARALVNEDLGLRRDPLVRRALRPAGAAELGRGQVRLPPGGFAGGLGAPLARTRHSGPSPGSAAAPAGTTATGSGGCAGCSTSPWAARGCAAAAAIPSR